MSQTQLVRVHNMNYIHVGFSTLFSETLYQSTDILEGKKDLNKFSVPQNQTQEKLVLLSNCYEHIVMSQWSIEYPAPL